MLQAIKALASSGLSMLGGLKTYFIIGGVCLAVGTYGGWTVNGWRFDAAISKQKAEASQLLAKANEQMVQQILANGKQKAEADAKALEQQRNMEDAHVANLALNNRLAALLERLRKPGLGEGGSGSVSATTGSPGNCSELQATINKLSGALGRIAAKGTELARSADREAAVATAAHEWSSNP